MHLVEAGGRKILLDCGLVRSPRSPGLHLELFPFAPETLDAVVLSHAHVDHCGALPALIRRGFAGPIFCTPATRDLLGLVLGNSARIQEEDARVGQVLGRANTPDAGHVVSGDVGRTVAQCVPVPYNQPTTILDDFQLRLLDAGHVLGSAIVQLAVPGTDREATLVFSGDLGRRGSPILRDPTPLPAADLLICESTNGDRAFDPLPVAAAAFEGVVRRTVEHGGKVLIPAFSLGRTQLLVQCLLEGIRRGRLPNVPVYVDSPMGEGMAVIYRRHPECLRDPATADLGLPVEGGAQRDVSSGVIRYVHAAEESKDLDSRREPCVLIAPGGMCEGGRIVRHVKHNIDDPRCTLLMVGYQAPHTLGHRLLKPGPIIRIHGQKCNRWAEVVEMSGFSGHPDQGELLAFLEPEAIASRKVRLVHGEPEPAGALVWALRRRGFQDVALAGKGERVTFG